MTEAERFCCARCGARLRRDRRPKEVCGSCEQAASDPLRALPPNFFAVDPILSALEVYDFGMVFLAMRRHTHWSQQTLGGIIDLDQSQISAVERGERHLRDVAIIARIATSFRIPARRFGFPDVGATVGQTRADRKLVSWVYRRDFGQHIAALTLAVAGLTGLDLDRLLALLPQAEPTDTRRVGVADVEVIEQLTAGFRRQDFAGGSAVAREIAVTQVHAALPLLGAHIDPELRPRLLLATADLAAQAGWMSFGANRHEDARRLWMIGLHLARGAEHPQSTDLTVYLLADLALQAVHLERPQEAVHLARISDTAAVGRYPVSESTLGLLKNIQAQAFAAGGDAKTCDRACSQATEHFSGIDPAASPPWTAYFSELSNPGCGGQGSAYYELARLGRDPVAADRAVLLLREGGGDRYGPSYARFRARYLPDLSGAHALAGDVGTAVTVGHQAVELVSALPSSSKERDRLRILNNVLEPLHTSPGVAELRDRLSITAA
ncbi:MAG: helix-turn-helix domain-containing protein [Pseudonocardiaceae bacterium]